MIRIWYKSNGIIDSCKVNVKTKKAAKNLFKQLLPSAKIGYTEKV